MTQASIQSRLTKVSNYTSKVENQFGTSYEFSDGSRLFVRTDGQRKVFKDGLCICHNIAPTWDITDGSAATLQLARKIDDTTWEYRQWLDDFDPDSDQSVPLSYEYKLKNWHSDKWTVEKINVEDHSIAIIKNAVITFGYELISVVPLKLYGYSEEDSIQLICESIFECYN